MPFCGHRTMGRNVWRNAPACDQAGTFAPSAQANVCRLSAAVARPSGRRSTIGLAEPHRCKTGRQLDQQDARATAIARDCTEGRQSRWLRHQQATARLDARPKLPREYISDRLLATSLWRIRTGGFASTVACLCISPPSITPKKINSHCLFSPGHLDTKLGRAG